MKGMLLCAVLAAVFAIVGTLLSREHTTSFLGLISKCLAGLSVCVGGIVFLYGWQPLLAIVLLCVLGGILAVGLIMVTVVGISVAKAARGEPEQACRYIVVLGAKGNGAEPSVTLRERIDRAFAYLSAHPETVAVLSGGQGSDEAISEARCMYNSLTRQGIDPQRLWLEEQATSTWENLRFSLRVIEKKTGIRPDSVGVVSSAYHLYRAGVFAGKCGVKMVGIPAKTENRLHYVNYYLREIAGIWHYYLLGGLYHD